MLNSCFTPYHQVLIVISLLFYIASVFFFEFSRKQTVALVLLLLGTFVFKIVAISLDEFLNLWDEQFHALVAKNMAKDLFNPKLYPDAVLPYNYRLWYLGHTWMHRPPLFLMQMALSIKMLGVTPFAIRLPSVICFTFAVFCVYRIGVNLITTRIGYLSALLFSANYFFTELISGAETADHNDLVFMCYIAASIWAWTEYYNTKKTFGWLFFIALFSSFAVLTNGAIGYLVFVFWIIVLAQKKNTFRSDRTTWLDLLKTLSMAIVLPLAWYLYSTNKFPLEAGMENEYYFNQFIVPVEGHKGTELFYFEAFRKTIGYYAPFFILPAIVLLRYYIREKVTYRALISLVLIVFILFTYSKTKLLASVLPVYFVLFLGFGTIMEYAYQHLKLFNSVVKRIFFCLVFLYCGILLSNIEGLQKNHTYLNRKEFWLVDMRSARIDWYNTCLKIKEELKDDKYVIFNCDFGDNVKLMFYTDHIAYENIPTHRDLYFARSKGYKVAAIDRGNLPQSILDNKEIVKIKRMRDRVVAIDTVIIKVSDNRFFSLSEWMSLNAGPEAIPIQITTFADGYSRLQDMKGKSGSINYTEEGFITFVHDRYELYEKFKLTPLENGHYAITTFFGDNLTLDEGSAPIQIRQDEKKILQVELLKYKSK